MVKLSIITINYNNVNGLARTFASVFEQSNSMFEYVVVDGGSTDGSKDLIERSALRIAYWVSEPDRGIYHAMNKGIEKANGEYLLFLNSGDAFHDKKVVERCLPLLLGEDIITGNQEIVAENGATEVWQSPESITFYSLFRYTLAHQSSFIRRQCFVELGAYDEQVRITADWKWFILALCLNRKSYKKLNVIISDFYMDGISSDVNNSSEMAVERDKVYREYFNVFLPDYERFIDMDYQVEDLKRSRLFKIFKSIKKIIGKAPVRL